MATDGESSQAIVGGHSWIALLSAGSVSTEVTAGHFLPAMATGQRSMSAGGVRPGALCLPASMRPGALNAGKSNCYSKWFANFDDSLFTFRNWASTNFWKDQIAS
jgi:hypothetical protein